MTLLFLFTGTACAKDEGHQSSSSESSKSVAQAGEILETSREPTQRLASLLRGYFDDSSHPSIYHSVDSVSTRECRIATDNGKLTHFKCLVIAETSFKALENIPSLGKRENQLIPCNVPFIGWVRITKTDPEPYITVDSFIGVYPIGYQDFALKQENAIARRWKS